MAQKRELLLVQVWIAKRNHALELAKVFEIEENDALLTHHLDHWIHCLCLSFYDDVCASMLLLLLLRQTKQQPSQMTALCLSAHVKAQQLQSCLPLCPRLQSSPLAETYRHHC